MFDSNPYILNLSDIEVENLFHKSLQEGLSKEEILDSFYDTIIM